MRGENIFQYICILVSEVVRLFGNAKVIAIIHLSSQQADSITILPTNVARCALVD